MRSWRWCAGVLLILAVTGFSYWVWPGLLPALAQGDGEYYCAAGHFSVRLPPGWQVVDDSEIRKSISLLTRSGKAAQVKAPTYDFGLSPTGRVNEYPYVLATVVPTEPIAESDVREAVEAISRGLRAELEKSSLYSHISVHDPHYEKASHRLRLDFTGQVLNRTRVDGRIYALFVSNGAVFFYCYAPGGHLAEYDSVFHDMVKSVSFDKGYGWWSTPSLPGLQPAGHGLSSSDVLLLLLYLFLAVGFIVGLGAILVLGLRKRRTGDRASAGVHAGVSAAEAESLPRAESSETAGAPTREEESRAGEAEEQARQIAPDLTDEQRQRIIEEERLRRQEERLRQHLREPPEATGFAPRGEPARPTYSFGQPLWQLAVLSIATFGLYQIYWFYCTWKHLKHHTGKQFSPGWRTVGLCVPIWGLVLAWNLFHEISDLRTHSGLPNMPHPDLLLVLYILANAAWRLPEPAWLITLLSVGPLLVVQAALNGLWRAVQPGMLARSRPSGWEIAILCLGAVLISLVAIEFLIPE